MKRARKAIRKEQKRKMRAAANVVKAEMRQQIDKVFANPSGDTKRATTVSVRGRGGTVTAEIGPKGPPGVHAAIHEKGKTVTRRRGSRKRHTATYPARPFIEPAVRKTADEVFRRIGQVFKVV